MKKVLHVVEAFGGGVFTFLVDLLNSMVDEYEVVLVCSRRPQTPIDYKNYFDKRIKIIELKNGARGIGYKDLKLYLEIKEIINKETPDILHLHSSKAGAFGRLCSKDKNMKIFYNPHGFAFLMENEGGLHKKIYKLIEKICSKKCGTIIACSNGEYKEALKLSKNSYLINNGINTNKLKKFEEKCVDKENLKICTLGRVSYQKNPKEFNEIAEAFPNIEFTWIGEGELQNELTSSNIKVTGWLEKDEALKIMNKSDIFILTSLWEGLPIALLEAMYYKKICMVSNCIGNKDVIKNKENGFICKKSEDFIRIIEKVIDGTQNIEKIKENAQKDIMENYNFDIVAKKYMCVYENSSVNENVKEEESYDSIKDNFSFNSNNKKNIL